jgi:membrane protein DedA with SNARE-associated domain
MQQLVETLVANGYLIVFLWVLAAQAGIPLPAIPILLAAGALAGTEHLSLGLITLLAVLASLLADSLWFLLGRRRGHRVLGVLCRLSIEPESCVRSTETMFARNQALTMVLGKFVPGLSTMAPPLAGMFRMTWPRFLALDTLGATLWTLAFVLPGYALSDQLERLAENAALTGTWLLGIILLAVLAIVIVKVVRRRTFLRNLRVARSLPEQLQSLLGTETPPFLIDLRHGLDIEADPRLIPGAIRMLAEQIEQQHSLIPRDRDIVVYCT